MVPETMSPSLKYLIVRSMAARKSSALPMSLTATWGVLLGRTWVEVMWSSAPDGGCVGTGRPAAGVTAGSGESRRAPIPDGDSTDRPLAHSHGTEPGTARSTWVEHLPRGSRRVTIGVSWTLRPHPHPPCPSP